MKKQMLAVCVLSLFLFACKKDATPAKTFVPDGGKKVALNIRTNDFLQQVETLPGPGNRTAGKAAALRDSALATKVSDLYYLLYDQAGNRLKMMHQDVNVSPDFGSFYDSAAPGYYTIVLLASQRPLDVSLSGQLSGSAFSVPTSTPGEIGNMPDIFYTNEGVYVDKTYDTIELNMSLARIVGNLQINILDMPQPGSGDTSVSIKITPEASTFLLDAGTPVADTATANAQRIYFDTFSAYVLNTEVPLTVTFNYVDQATGLPQTRVVNNVYCYRSKRTILSGYLYGSAPANGGIKISVQDSWYGGDTIAF